MNGKQAGAFAVGVLAVAIAIIVFGGVLDHPGSPAVPETASTAASGASQDKSPASAKIVSAKQDAGTAKPDQAGGQGLATSKSADSQPVAKEKVASASNAASAGAAAMAAGTSKPAPIAPSFDILRVEPDGSTVIAGRAQPGSKVEVMDKGKPLLSTKADSSGSFVSVFDKPLAPGNYELTLKSTGKNDATETSAEVATVSVPKHDDPAGLLAMVSKPGEASRIITAPQPQGAQTPVGSKVAASGPASSDKEVASAEQPSGQSSPGVVSSSQQAKAPIHVDAVEIEGDKVYVAGSAPHGSTVRAYADDKYVGEDRATSENRFVVNGTMTLAPGKHTIRADLVDPKSGKVMLRASVPFDRPSGKDFAAVAPQVAAERSGSGATGGVAVHAPAATAQTQAAASSGGAGSGPATVVQPALTDSDSFVIIRRGDTLWQISRRVYGRGIRYTTIYLANTQEISNPNLILPGQVFDVPGKPKKTLDQAEQLHRELLRKEGRY